MNILFVCLGNICRSPMAEYIAKNIIKENNIKNVYIKSCGLHNYHEGEDMHKQTRKILEKNNIKIDQFNSKKINNDLYDWSDYILVMDDSNVNQLLNMFNENNKIQKITDYSYKLNYQNVPDPWYTNNFELVFNILNDAIYNFFKLKGVI